MKNAMKRFALSPGRLALIKARILENTLRSDEIMKHFKNYPKPTTVKKKGAP